MKHANLEKIVELLDEALTLSDAESHSEMDFSAYVSNDIFNLMRKLRAKIESEKI